MATSHSLPVKIDDTLGGRFWTMKDLQDDDVRRLAAKLGNNDLLGRLLMLRGVVPDDVDAFMQPTLRNTFPDPSSFADMDKAASLTLDALMSGKSVTVFADYDVDGGTSAAILARYFREWGRELGLYVPDRLTEGYGPTPEAFQHLKASGAELSLIHI